jgi:hypothetical protein
MHDVRVIHARIKKRRKVKEGAPKHKSRFVFSYFYRGDGLEKNRVKWKCAKCGSTEFMEMRARALREMDDAF